MDPTRLMSQTATITRVTQDGVVDIYGNPTETTTTEIACCEFQQQQQSEDTRDTNRQSQTWLLFLEPGTDITGSDRVTIDGLTYEVDGPPWRARNPRTGEESHVEARVRRTV